MWIEKGLMKNTGMMIKEEVEVVNVEMVMVSESHYSELVEDIKTRMKVIRHAQNSEGGVEEEGQFSLVRVVGGI